jgi:hypothetical protein
MRVVVQINPPSKLRPLSGQDSLAGFLRGSDEGKRVRLVRALVHIFLRQAARERNSELNIKKKIDNMNNALIHHATNAPASLSYAREMHERARQGHARETCPMA